MKGLTISVLAIVASMYLLSDIFAKRMKHYRACGEMHQIVQESEHDAQFTHDTDAVKVRAKYAEECGS